MNTHENMLFVEKYRPKKIEDCILPADTKKTFKAIIDSGQMQNLLLCGSAGCGKTTIAKVLCEEMDIEYLFINASENGNVDTIRNTIRNFASTVSLTDSKKAIILDEADGITPQAQAILRGSIEEFSNNCRFIFTCNFKNRVIEPIHSRCSVVEFKVLPKDKKDIISQFFKRAKFVLDSEKITYDTKILGEFVIRHFPDFRRTLGELQRYGIGNGTIDSGILARYSDVHFNDLFVHMKAKNFTEVRKWVAQNSDVDTSLIFRKLYDSLVDHVDKCSIPNIVLILAEYQYKMAFSADHEICLAACIAQLMLEAQFNP